MYQFGGKKPKQNQKRQTSEDSNKMLYPKIITMEK